MDKLEHYLDQVCRGIAGPRSLRQHVRQELREHLLDAAAEHRAAGLGEQEALDKALDDFGGPDQVRLELEETHGHRLMAVVIDKAMQWKERTMRAKWLWTAWAHAMLAAVIVGEVLFVMASMVFIMPKVQQIVQESGARIDSILDGAGATFALLRWFADNGVWVLLAVAIAWGLFEWRNRSENKTFLRLSVMGTLALLLLGVVWMVAAMMAIPMAVAAPALMAQRPESAVSEEMAQVDAAMSELQQAMAKKDWSEVHEQANRAGSAMRRLAHLGGAPAAIVAAPQHAKVEMIRTQIESADAALQAVNVAASRNDGSYLETALQRFRSAYGELKATTRPTEGKN